uniref:Ig-like domain-containing protein n=1 Tax=Oncorhynchus kisutch TaxID=8019 RepID=A0A8C7IA86_ONCKI
MALRTAGSVLVVFLWSVTVVLGQDGWSVTYTTQSICTLRGSTVDLFCSYTYPRGYTVTTTFWFTKKYDVENYVSLLDDPDYKGRVTYRSNKKNGHTLKITDLRESDSATYMFRFITDQTRGKYFGSPGVTLSVTDLQVKVTTTWWSTTLTCSTTCTLTGNPTYTWYRNSKIVQEDSSPSYTVQFKTEDSFYCAVKGINSPAVSFEGHSYFHVTYTQQRICTLKGTSVDISCSYTYPSGHTVSETNWYTNGKLEEASQILSPGYGRRVEYLGNMQSDSILRITDLREEDSAEYKFRFRTDQTTWEPTFPGTTLTVTGSQVEVTPKWSSEYKTLSCSTTCTLTDNPIYIWYKNGQHLDESTSPQYKDPVSSNYEDSYSCTVKGHEDLHSPAVCVQGQSCNRVTYTKRRICVLKGSTVDISCTYVGYYYATSSFWFRSDKSTPEDLTTDPGYAGRVEYTGTYRGPFTLRITDLREEDSAEYRFTFKANNIEWGHSFPGTTLSVTGLQVKVTPAAEGQKTLTCITTCTLTDNPTYIWYKNGQQLDEPTSQQHSSNMLVVWDSTVDIYSCAVEGHEALHSPVVCFQVEVTPKHYSKYKTLTCSTTCILTGNPTYTWYKNGQIETVKTSTYSVYPDAVDSYSCAVKGHEDLHSPAVCVQGQSCNRVNYNKMRTCVLKGSTVDISCTVGYYYITSTFWFRSDKSTPEDLTRDPGYAGRVKYTGTYEGPFTLRITDLREEDSAEYRFTFKTDNFDWGHSFPGTTLSVTGLQVKVTPAAEGQKTLTCITTCTLTDNPTYIWYKNGQNVQGRL